MQSIFGSISHCVDNPNTTNIKTIFVQHKRKLVPIRIPLGDNFLR